MFEVRENGLVVMASGWGQEGVGQQQNTAEQTPYQPRNEGQAPLSFPTLFCCREQSRAEGKQLWTELGAGAWQPRVRLGKDLS